MQKDFTIKTNLRINFPLLTFVLFCLVILFIFLKRIGMNLLGQTLEVKLYINIQGQKPILGMPQAVS